jgi:hypothetical protein
MSPSVLPDRERRHLLQFYLAPRLGYRARLAASAALVAAGIALQVFLSPMNLAGLLAVTLPWILAGSFLLLVRGYDAAPKSRRATNWEKTTRDRFREVRRLEQRVRRWDETLVDITCVTGAFGLLLIAGLVAGVAFAFSLWLGQAREVIVFAADAAALILPHWLTGTRRGWRPVALRQQIEALESALGVVEAQKSPPCQVQPMFRMAGKGQARMPMEARVFVRFPDGPDDFLGLQFQVALNNVQGTKYPYLYAVVIAKPSFGLASRHGEAFRRSLGGSFTVTADAAEDVDVIVVRQRTTRTSGYHTSPAAIRRLAAGVWSCTAEVLEQATRGAA